MRLTNYIRETLALEIMRHRFSDEIEAFVTSRKSFASDVYDDLYRKVEREKIDALPAGWLPETNLISVQFGDTGAAYASLYFNGGVYGSFNKLRKKSTDKIENINRRVLSKHNNHCAKVYAPDHRLSVRHQALISASKDLGERISAAEKQANAAINSVTTLPALLKSWPEIEPFTQRFFSNPTKLPAIPVGKLNEIFKLPVKKAA
jgi:hypothetical protein